MDTDSPIDIVYTACPHDCPSTCALAVERLDARTIGRVRGAADNSYTLGVCCAKVGEAEVLVNGGVRDILITSEIVGHFKTGRLAAIARRANIRVAVDDEANARELSDAATAAGAQPKEPGTAPVPRMAVSGLVGGRHARRLWTIVLPM